MKKRLLIFLSLLEVLALAFAAVLLIRPGGQINPHNIAKIKPGMTEKEVEETLGGPGRFFTQGTKGLGRRRLAGDHSF
jgi:hypothetical protein